MTNIVYPSHPGLWYVPSKEENYCVHLTYITKESYDWNDHYNLCCNSSWMNWDEAYLKEDDPEDYFGYKGTRLDLPLEFFT